MVDGGACTPEADFTMSIVGGTAPYFIDSSILTDNVGAPEILTKTVVSLCGSTITVELDGIDDTAVFSGGYTLTVNISDSGVQTDTAVVSEDYSRTSV